MEMGTELLLERGKTTTGKALPTSLNTTMYKAHGSRLPSSLPTLLPSVGSSVSPLGLVVIPSSLVLGLRRMASEEVVPHTSISVTEMVTGGKRPGSLLQTPNRARNLAGQWPLARIP